MTPVLPVISALNLPENFQLMKFTPPEGISHCDDLLAMWIPDGRVITAWRPSSSELQALNNGEPVYVQMWCGRSFPMTAVGVGEPLLVESIPKGEKTN